MKSRTIKLPLTGRTEIEVRAYLPTPSSALAIHNVIRDGEIEKSEWTISHIATGMQIKLRSANAPTRKVALEWSMLLSPDNDAWKLGDVKALRRECGPIWRAARAALNGGRES